MNPECPVCGKLDGYTYVDRLADPGLLNAPQGFLEVIGGWPRAAELDDTSVKCPSCGSEFTMTYSCGFGEDDVELKRL